MKTHTTTAARTRLSTLWTLNLLIGWFFCCKSFSTSKFFWITRFLCSKFVNEVSFWSENRNYAIHYALVSAIAPYKCIETVWKVPGGYITFLILQWNYWVTSASPQPWPLSPCLTTWVVATYSGPNGKGGRRTSPANFVGKLLQWGETIWGMWMLCIWSISLSCVTCATTLLPTWKHYMDTRRDAACSWWQQLINSSRPGTWLALQVVSHHYLRKFAHCEIHLLSMLRNAHHGNFIIKTTTNKNNWNIIYPGIMYVLKSTVQLLFRWHWLKRLLPLYDSYKRVLSWEWPVSRCTEVVDGYLKWMWESGVK